MQTWPAPPSAKTTVLSPAPVSSVCEPGRTAAAIVSSTSSEACSERGCSPSSTWKRGASRRRARRSTRSVLLRRGAHEHVVHLDVRRLPDDPEDRRRQLVRLEHLPAAREVGGGVRGAPEGPRRRRGGL